ncbi:MAG: iron ABC transporter permease [Clostridia bacterium]|nr:iron ABC transporter permease [Clostridia bacterium]
MATNKSSKVNVPILFSFSILIFISVFAASIFIGSVHISFWDVIDGLMGKGDNAVIIRSLRVPRAIGSVICGAALATAGLLLQSATSNELCAPNIIGINSGAGFAVMVLTCFFPNAHYMLSPISFIGALCATAIVMGISVSNKNTFTRSGIVLSGVAVSAFFSAGVSFLSLRFPDALPSYTAFSVGGLSGVYFEDILPVIAPILILILFSFLISQKLNLLYLGDESAMSLGVNTKRLRVIVIIIAAALSALSVSFAGLIGFVGLIVPHISRRIAGHDNRILIPLSALIGGTLVTLADILGRVVFAPGEIPCGIFLSALGAPFFLFLLISRRGGSRT